VGVHWSGQTARPGNYSTAVRLSFLPSAAPLDYRVASGGQTCPSGQLHLHLDESVAFPVLGVWCSASANVGRTSAVYRSTG
jgi:hypothetical protein